MKKIVLIFTALTLFVVFFKKITVIGMIVVGSIFFPEASAALRHYCFGDGSQLEVNADYIKRSPVVQRELATMRVGEKRKVGFRQAEDWRLSFALNPFTIKKGKNKVEVSQWMKFSDNDRVITWLFFIPVPDNIVHTFDCKPYLFHSEWTY